MSYNGYAVYNYHILNSEDYINTMEEIVIDENNIE